jgi:hypothetical protein
MNPAQWQQIKSAFVEALHLEPAQRSADILDWVDSAAFSPDGNLTGSTGRLEAARRGF